MTSTEKTFENFDDSYTDEPVDEDARDEARAQSDTISAAECYAAENHGEDLDDETIATLKLFEDLDEEEAVAEFEAKKAATAPTATDVMIAREMRDIEELMSRHNARLGWPYNKPGKKAERKAKRSRKSDGVVVIKARREGTCPVCKGYIEIESRIAKVGGVWVCADCYDNTEESKLSEKVDEVRDRRSTEYTDSEWVGEVGKSLNVSAAKVIGRPWWRSRYGVTNCYIMITPEKNVVVWKTTSILHNVNGDPAHPGDVVRFRAKVRAHSVRDGVKQTVVERAVQK